MTQAVITNAAAVVTGQPIITAAPANLAEPTMEELAALVPEPAAEELVDYVRPGEEGGEGAPGAEPGEAATAEPAPAAEPEAAAAPEAPAEVDAALERAEAAAKKAREGSKRYKEAQRLHAESQHQARVAAQEAEHLRRETQAAKEREAAYLKDPYGELKKRGMTDVQLAERAMKENTPEAVTARLETQLQEERTARLALEKRIETERETARREAAHQRAAADYLVAAKENADAYPDLAAAKPARQMWAAQEALAQIQRNGHATGHFTNAMIVEAAGKWLASHLEELGVKKTPAAAAPTTTQKPTVRKTSGVTLTNAMAQTRTVAAAKWDDLTDEQQLAHIAAGLPDPTS